MSLRERRGLRVLLVSANYSPSVGGIERFVEVLAEELAERGHRVDVACCRAGRAPLRERSNDVGIVRLPASDLPRRLTGVPYPLPSPRALFRALHPLIDAADVVHVQDAVYVTSVASLVRARKRGIASVLTQHVGPVPLGSRALDRVQAIATRAAGPVVRRADAVVTYNDAVATWAATTWGIPTPRVLPSGVRMRNASPAERSEVRRGLGVNDERIIAVFVGRDVPKKHLDTFLAAADPASYDLLAVTDRRGPSPPGTRLLPFDAPDRFQRLLTACDVFVLPSEAEGFPLALQEALVAGLPCVITPHEGYERYLGKDDVMFVERNGESIRRALRTLAASPARRETLASRARLVGSRSFDAATFAGAYESLYREVVERHVRSEGTDPVATM